MKTFNLGLVIASVLAAPAFAQQLELPRPSPNAKVSQTVGLTEISVDYSSPGVKGRDVFATVVPPGKIWREGANNTTRITFSKPVEIGGAKIAAGAYALFAIPGDEWTLIVNKDTQASQQSYKQDLDVARVQAKPQTIGKRERMIFAFADTTDDSTRLELEWDRVRVGMPISVQTGEQVTEAIAGVERNSWRPLNAAARYLLESKKDHDGCLRLVDQSLKLREEWFNDWTKAQCLAGAGRRDEAKKFAQRAYELGSKNPDGFFFEPDVKKALADW
jgi:hypothetical protein